MLTGWGGDDLFAWLWGRPWAVLAARVRPVPRDVLRIGYLASPRFLRTQRERRRANAYPLPWLRPRANREIVAQIAAHGSDHPRRWDAHLEWLAGRRYFAVTQRGLARVAEVNGCAIAYPLTDHRFLGALARAGGRRGWPTRTEAFLELFSDLLPEDVCRRTTKAWFDVPFWSTYARDFIARWDGGGVDQELVDPEELRKVWNQPEPDARTSLLLQTAWLASRRGDRARPQTALAERS